MPSGYAFAMEQSDLNRFLYAVIGTEAGGMHLSVISAFARAGLDPWEEARRLASLPRTLATDGLARSIAAMPSSLWPMAEASPIAARLVGLLPCEIALPVFGAKQAWSNWRWLFFAAVAVAVLSVLAASLSTAPAGGRFLPDPVHPAGAPK